MGPSGTAQANVRTIPSLSGGADFIKARVARALSISPSGNRI